MERAFRLRWAKGGETRIYQEGEWQLRFRDGAAYDTAKKNRKLETWWLHKNTPVDEIIYTFHKRGRLADPLNSLLAAGISLGEIEMSDLGRCSECEQPTFKVHDLIQLDGTTVPWPQCKDHLKQYADLAEAFLGPDPSSE